MLTTFKISDGGGSDIYAERTSWFDPKFVITISEEGINGEEDIEASITLDSEDLDRLINLLNDIKPVMKQ